MALYMKSKPLECLLNVSLEHGSDRADIRDVKQGYELESKAKGGARKQRMECLKQKMNNKSVCEPSKMR